nr:hypothetical protein Iba_scaffold1534CG0010 [Ipomoea batatas]
MWTNLFATVYENWVFFKISRISHGVLLLQPLFAALHSGARIPLRSDPGRIAAASSKTVIGGGDGGHRRGGEATTTRATNNGNQLDHRFFGLVEYGGDTVEVGPPSIFGSLWIGSGGAEAIFCLNSLDISAFSGA